MYHVSLPQEDSALLRNLAVTYFKERFPEYLDLVLTLEGEGLILTPKKNDDNSKLIAKMLDIYRKSKVAIGISYVSLIDDGKEVLNLGRGMVATIENPTIDYQLEQIDFVPTSTERRTGTPKGVNVLMPIEEVASAAVKIRAEDLIACLGEDEQTRYKVENRELIEAIADRLNLSEISDGKVTFDEVMQIIPALELNGQVGIEPKYAELAIAWHWLWKGAQVFAGIPQRAKESIENLKNSPLGGLLTEKTDAPATSRRSRKTPTPGEETASENETNGNGSTSETRRITFRGGSAIAKNKEAMILVLGEKKNYAKFAQTLIDSQPAKRQEEFLTSAIAGDKSWDNFFRPIKDAYLADVHPSEQDKASKALTKSLVTHFKKRVPDSSDPTD